MKYRSQRNLGYGRNLKHAIKNILHDGYGESSYATQRTHLARLKLFAEFLKEIGVADLRMIERYHVLAYADYLRDRLEASEIGVHFAQNCLSSVNVLMSFIRRGQYQGESPSKLLGRRTYVRKTEPSGLYHETFAPAVERLRIEGEWRLALLIALCRYLGARFREASLLHLRTARRQAAVAGTVTICRGSKGGRAKKIPRVLEAPESLIELLAEGVDRVDSRCLVSNDQSYIQWYGYAHRHWAKWAPTLGLSTRNHEFRAAYACERLEHLTGVKAPVASRPGASPIVRTEADRLSDPEARAVIATEMGHNRPDVLLSYCGSPS